MKTREQMIV